MTRQLLVGLLLRAVLSAVFFFLLMSAACLVSIERAERAASRVGPAIITQNDFAPGAWKSMKEGKK